MVSMMKAGLRPLKQTLIGVRRLSTQVDLSVDGARSYCENLVREKDRSSYILNSYVPKQARDAFIAIRSFNIDTARVSDTVSRPEIAKMRFEFWKSAIQKVFSPSQTVPQEPVAVLLANCLRNSNITLSKRFFITLIQTREAYLGNPPFRNLDAMASYGEGTYSQLNYLTQEALYSVSPTTSRFLNEHGELVEQVENIVAHIGQATGITSFLRGFGFYVSRKGFVPLPVDIMAKHNVSQESILQTMAGDSKRVMLDPAVSEVVFETATRANDHLISASTLLENLKTSLHGSIPDAILVPAMVSIPAKLYLERLENCNFDVVHSKLAKSEWRLPYRSYKCYRLRRI
jgi:NADH dehydrogenase [ubiquinone] 1 alpha subcomplex assembly factor 6